MTKDSYQDILYAEGPPKRIGMDVPHRAKQFAPFEALRGLQSGLRESETKAEEENAEELCMKEMEAAPQEEG